LDHLGFTIACLGVGAVAGFLGGLLGIGGGVIIVPSLILLFDSIGLSNLGGPPGNGTTLVAVGTSLASILFTAASAARAQIRAGMVDWIVVKRWWCCLVIGSFASSYVAALLPASTMRIVIAAFLLFVASVMLTSWRPSPHRSLPGPALSALLSGLGGLISGIAGIGGGNVVVPTLIFHNVPVHRAIGTASALGFPIAIAGSLGYILRGLGATKLDDGFLGFVYLPALLAIVVTTVLFAPLGVRTALAIQPAPLRRIFGLILLALSARMIVAMF
jgi:uncharacterized membrane protein YfcA